MKRAWCVAVMFSGCAHVYVGSAAQRFADGKLTDQGSRDFIKQLLENLRDLTLRLRPR